MHHAQLAESVSAGGDATERTLAALRAAGLSGDQALAAIARTLDQQAFMLSASELFFGSACLFVLLAAFVWVAREPGPMAGTGPGSGAAPARGPGAAPPPAAPPRPAGPQAGGPATSR